MKRIIFYMRNLLFLGPGLIALGLTAYAISYFAPWQGDYLTFFYPALIQFMAGQTNLYDGSSPPFYNVPWLLGVWMPFAGFPYLVGQYVNRLLDILSVLASLWMFRREAPRVTIVFAMASMPFCSLIIMGQVDGLILLGVTLGYFAVRRRNAGLLSVALCLLAIKPVSVILVAVWFLAAKRQWKALLLPVAAVVLCSFFIGVDWPLRYVTYVLQHPVDPPRVELWRLDISPVLLGILALAALGAFILLVRQRGFDDWTFALALTTNFVFSPYLLWAHYVALIPVLLILTRRQMKLGVPVYISSFLLPWFGTAYPIALYAACWAAVASKRGHKAVVVGGYSTSTQTLYDTMRAQETSTT